MTFAPKKNRQLLNMDTIHYPTLNNNELFQGCDLVMGSGTDTCSAGKHTWVTEFIQGVLVSCRGFSNSLPVEDDLPITDTLITVVIWGGRKMTHSLVQTKCSPLEL